MNTQKSLPIIRVSITKMMTRLTKRYQVFHSMVSFNLIYMMNFRHVFTRDIFVAFFAPIVIPLQNFHTKSTKSFKVVNSYLAKTSSFAAYFQMPFTVSFGVFVNFVPIIFSPISMVFQFFFIHNLIIHQW